MKKKIALALVGLLVLTAMLTWPLYTKPVAAYTYPRSWRYCGMASVQTSSADMGGTTSIGLAAPGRPGLPPDKWSWNITFSAPRFVAGVGWIVDLTVPATTYPASPGYNYEPAVGWVRNIGNMTEDGYGWLFLNATGDVDCYTSNNSTGAYWISPSPKAGTKAADPGQFPSPGPDGVPGTADDGFGDVTHGNDTRGSSILYMITHVVTHYASAATGWTWQPLFTYDWTAVWTTAVAYDIVTEGNLNGVSVTVEGHAWEFFSGDDPTPGHGTVPYDDPKWNAYVTYAEAWSQHDVPTIMGPLDLQVGEWDKLVRWDCVIADISCDEVCNIIDIVMTALAFDAADAGLGTDGLPGTADDKFTKDPGYDPRGDVRPAYGLVNIVDIVRIALDFDKNMYP